MTRGRRRRARGPPSATLAQMPAPRHRQLRHRKLDRFRQKLWAIPAWLWLCIRHPGSGRAQRRSLRARTR